MRRCLVLSFILLNSFLTENESIMQNEDADCGCSKDINRNQLQKQTRDLNKKNMEKSSEYDYENFTGYHNKLYDEMVYIRGGKAIVGSDKPIISADGEGPARKIEFNAFWFDQHEVSNAQFEKFVNETGYVTDAEHFNTSFVLETFVSKNIKDHIKLAVARAPWWLPVNGTSWRHPTGPDSHFIPDHPVVHVSWNDAVSFCNHHHKRLPSEAEWEIACRANKTDRLFPWGNKEMPLKKHSMNIWQGNFPNENTEEDGYATTAPVWAYGEQNEHKLKNMVGNVWEWIEDWWSVRHHRRNVKPPLQGKSRVKKGGSFACKKDYCYRYRCGARQSNTPDSSALNLGFRCAADKKWNGGNGNRKNFGAEKKTDDSEPVKQSNDAHVSTARDKFGSSKGNRNTEL